MTTEQATELAPAHRTGYVQAGEVRIHYRALGKRGKTPLLINRGLSCFSYDWLGIADGLGAEREVAAFDMRGFGDSSWSAEKKCGIHDFVGDMIALMDSAS